MSLQEAVVLPAPLVGAISTHAHGLRLVIPEDGDEIITSLCETMIFHFEKTKSQECKTLN